MPDLSQRPSYYCISGYDCDPAIEQLLTIPSQNPVFSPPSFATPPLENRWWSTPPGPLTQFDLLSMGYAPPGYSNPQPALEPVGISEAENLEIDLEIERQADIVERVRLLGEYTDTIQPDRLMQVAEQIISGEVVGPPPAPPPTPDLAAIVPTPTVERGEFFTDLPEAPRQVEPDLYEAQLEEEPMGLDLSGIARGIVGGAAQSFVQDLNWDYGFDDALGDIVDYYTAPAPTPIPAPSPQPRGIPPPLANGSALPMAAYGGGCISNRDRAIAAASGSSPEMVDRVLHYARQGRHRRKRMLTKGDIGDISTMAALLGKNSDAFKTWLAKATR